MRRLYIRASLSESRAHPWRKKGGGRVKKPARDGMMVTTGGAATSAYTAVFAVGILLALLWLVSEPARSGANGSHEVPVEPLIVTAAAGLAGGVIGARLAFVALHMEYFRSRPGEALWFWQGGLAWAGGVAAALAAVALFILVRRLPLAATADRLIIPAALVHLSTWAGCLSSGCAFGLRIAGDALRITGGDYFASGAARWPSQLVGVVYSLLVLALLIALDGRFRHPGVQGALGFTLIFAGVLAISFTRADPSLLLAGYRLDTLSAALFTLLGILGVALARRSTPREVQP